MAKIQIKSEKFTPFGGIFSIMEQFNALLFPTIDLTLGGRCKLFYIRANRCASLYDSMFALTEWKSPLPILVADLRVYKI